MLFRLRYESDDAEDRAKFVESLNFGWEVVSRQQLLQARCVPERLAELDLYYECRSARPRRQSCEMI